MNFALDATPPITLADGALDTLGPLAASRGAGRPVLLVADPGLRGAGIIDAAEAVLRRAQLSVATFTAFKSDPTTAQTDAAAALARETGAGIVVALGGGSALDVGKAVAAIAPGAEHAAHYALCAHPFPPGTLPTICIPTTAGTGSETTRTSVLSLPSGAKVWLWGQEMKAAHVLLDPALSVSLPAHLTAATGIDALIHALEACTNARANPGNDLFCHEAIRLVATHLPRAVEHPADLEARAGLLWAAALAGIGIDNTGTAIGHNIGHALASLRPIHHGRAVGLAVLATLGWNAEHDTQGRFAAAGRAMGADDLPQAYERLLRGVGVKVSLAGEGHDGITAEQLAAQMGAEENLPMLRANARQPSADEIRQFASTVLQQA